MKRFNKFVPVLILVSISLGSVYAARTENDAYAYSELYSMFVSGFYPGVASQADSFLEKYPTSLYSDDVMLHQAVSLFNLGRYEASRDVLNNLLFFSKVSVSADVAIEARYWTGRCYYAEQKYDKAYSAFLNAANRMTSSKLGFAYPLYDETIFYTAKTTYDDGKYTQARPFLEYIVTRPFVFENETTRFYPVCAMLFTVYESQNSYESVISLYKQLNLESFPVTISGPIQMVVSDSYSALGQFEEALKLYTSLFSNQNKTVAVVALQKAYVLSSSISVPVIGYSTAEIVEKASTIFGADSLLLQEFRVRLGIVAFDDGKYEEAVNYFDEAEQNLTTCVASETDTSGLNEVIALYRSAITSLSSTQESTTQALAQLSPYLSEAHLYHPWTLVAATKYSILAGDTDSGSAYFKTFCSLKEAAETATATEKETVAEAKTEALTATEEITTADVVTIIENTPQYQEIPWESLHVYGSYWYALSLFQAKDYKGVTSIFESIPFSSLDTPSIVLYAQSLMLCGKSDQALSMFKQLEQTTSSDSALIRSVKLNYAKAGLLTGQSNLAYSLLAPVTNNSEEEYLAGLALFNMGKWQESETLLSSIANKTDTSITDYGWTSWALYYSAFAQYRQQKLEQAYNTFDIFMRKYPSHPLVWNAAITSSRCALQIFQLSDKPNLRTSVLWLTKAEEQASKAIDTALSSEQKGQASLLAASIASDLGKYDEAIKLLEPYSKLETPFGMGCLYQLADVLVKKGEINKADTTFEEVQTRFPGTQLAEDSLYRRGEIRYNNGEWERASILFAKYRRSYPSGNYSDSSLFINADSLAELKQYDQAILLYQELQRAYPESTYIYTSLVNLAALYRQKGEYGSAAEALISLRTRYGSQANKADIEKMEAEVALLLAGLEEQSAVELASYYSAGQEATEEGRRSGTRLAKLYMASPVKKEEAEKLLLKLLPVMYTNVDKERDIIASSSKMLGSYYREQNNYLMAAKYYLDAAEYYSGIDSESAAQSLYGAIDSFDYAGLSQDAQSTYELLRKTYIGSIWAERAANIIEEK